MPNRSNFKGRELEESVYFIQRSVLETDPRFRGRPFTIARNQTLVVSGVPHEIDVLVRVDPGTDFEVVLIFECKNISKAVDKNMVLILSEKIRAAAAAKGFLVAAKFGKPARAQAALDKRVKLVKCASEFVSLFDSLQLMHVDTELLNIGVTARILGPDRLPLPSSNCLDLNEIWMDAGVPISLGTFVRQQADRTYTGKFKAEQSRLNLEGMHEGIAACRIQFDPGEMTCGGREIEWMELRCNYRITNTVRRLVSKFEIEGYGRTFAFEGLEGIVKDKSVQIVMVEPHKLSPPSTE